MRLLLTTMVCGTAACGGLQLQKTKPSDHYDGVPVYLKKPVKLETWRYAVDTGKAGKISSSFASGDNCEASKELPLENAKEALIAHEVTYKAEADYRTLFVASAKYMLWGTRTLDVKIGDDASLGEAAATSSGTAAADLAGILSSVVAAGKAMQVEMTEATKDRVVVSCTKRTWLRDQKWDDVDPNISVTVDVAKREREKSDSAK